MQLNKNFFLTLFKCPSLFFANNNGQVNKLTPLLFCDFIHYNNSNNNLLSQETELKEVAGKPKLHNTKINLSLMNEVHKNEWRQLTYYYQMLLTAFISFRADIFHSRFLVCSIAFLFTKHSNYN